MDTLTALASGRIESNPNFASSVNKTCGGFFKSLKITVGNADKITNGIQLIEIGALSFISGFLA